MENSHHHSTDCHFDSSLKWWRHNHITSISSLAIKLSRKATHLSSYWFNRSWHACIWWSFLSHMSICRNRHCSIPRLPPPFPLHWNQYSDSYIDPLLWTTNSYRWAGQDALHFMVWKLCMTVQNMACLPQHHYHSWNTPPTASLC